jgi:hypothetical protein
MSVGLGPVERGEIKLAALEVKEHRPRQDALPWRVLFAGRQNETPRWHLGTLGRVLPKSGSAGRVTLRPKETRGFALELTVIKADPRRIVVNHEEGVFQNEGPMLEGIGG